MKKNIVTAFCSIALLTGCQQAEEIENMGEKLPMSVEAGIVKALGSRYVAVGNDPNNLSFMSGNAIGVAVKGGKFVKWTLNSSSWTPEGDGAYWPDKEESYTFNAFYPYANVPETGNITMPNLSDGQDGTMAWIAEHDFLATTKTESYDENAGKVSFTDDYAFKHVSSLLQITLKGEGDLLGSTITSIELKGSDIVSSSTYKFSDSEGSIGDVTVKTDEKGDEISISPKHTMNADGYVIYFIVNAGTVELDKVSLTIKYMSGETPFTATLSKLGKSGEKFGIGKYYKYGIKVSEGVLTVSGNEISTWGDGGEIDDIIINGIQDSNSNNEGGNNEGDGE